MKMGIEIKNEKEIHSDHSDEKQVNEIELIVEDIPND